MNAKEKNEKERKIVNNKSRARIIPDSQLAVSPLVSSTAKLTRECHSIRREITN